MNLYVRHLYCEFPFRAFFELDQTFREINMKTYEAVLCSELRKVHLADDLELPIHQI